MKRFLNEQVEHLMSWVAPDVEACRKTATEVLLREPNTPREVLAGHVVAYAKKQAATVGGVTGLAAGPFTMLPAALADMAAVLRIEGAMVGAIAALLDPDSLDDPEQFRADVMAIVFPAAVSQALRQIGIRAGEQLTKSLVRRAAGKGGLETILRIAGKVLGARLTGRSILSKGIPVVGVGIGAGVELA